MSTSSQKKKHIKAVRPKLRAKEPLLGVFMWGINYSASISVGFYTPRSGDRTTNEKGLTKKRRAGRQVGKSALLGLLSCPSAS